MNTPRRVYVGIAVNEYQHFDSLKFCVQDTWNVASLLKLRGQYSDVQVLTEATASAMLVELRKVVAPLRSGDVLVLHLALHGVLDANDDHVYLLGAVDERFEPEHCLTLSSLRSEVGSVDGLDVVLLVDACRGALGGAAAKVDSARKVSVALDRNREAARDGGVQRTGVRRSRFTEVFACSDHEIAHELPVLKQGLFTRAFLDVLAAREQQRVPLAIDDEFEDALVQRMEELGKAHASEVRVTPFLTRRAGHVPVLVADWSRTDASKVGAVVAPRPKPLESLRPALLAGDLAPNQNEAVRSALRWFLAIVVLGAACLGYFGWPGLYRLVGAKPSPGNAQGVAKGAGEETVDMSGPIAGGHFVNAIGQTIIFVASGASIVGSPASEAGRDVNELQHSVIIARVYGLASTEVTQKQWYDLMGTRPWRGESYVMEGDDVAATYISWNDAIEFCHVLTERERQAGRLPSGYGYCLPTEAEWERAARAGSAARFACGDDEKTLRDFAVYSRSSHGQYAHAVMSKRPNGLGFFDMAGNVSEWVADFAGPGAKTNTYVDGVADPLCRIGSHRIYRGGCWFYSADNCRSASRSSVDPNLRLYSLGFRPALAARPHVK